jgi:hypothetical protein
MAPHTRRVAAVVLGVSAVALFSGGIAGYASRTFHAVRRALSEWRLRRNAPVSLEELDLWNLRPGTPFGRRWWRARSAMRPDQFVVLGPAPAATRRPN